MEDSSNNLNWTSDASAGKAMFGELRWLGVGLLRAADDVRFGLPASGLGHVARICCVEYCY